MPLTIEEHLAANDHSYRLGRATRLRQSARFQAVRNQGRWWSHRLLAMGTLANGQDFSRCGFSASKKIGAAVVRNRARRRMREALRMQWPAVIPGWDIVLAAREPVREAPFSEIQAAVATLLRRAHLLREAEQVADQASQAAGGKLAR